MTGGQPDKFSWLLRQETGSLAEQCLLQALVIACSPKPTKVEGDKVMPPMHTWMSPAEAARRTGMNERTIPSVYRRLCERGLITEAGRRGKTGQIKVYRLMVSDSESPKDSAGLRNEQSPHDSSPLESTEDRRNLRPIKLESPKDSAAKTEGFCVERPKEPASTYIEVSQSFKPKAKPETEQRSAPKRRIPDDWQPDAKLLEWAKSTRPDLNLTATVENFRDHWLAMGEARASWPASFRTWVKRERVYEAGRKGRATSHNGLDSKDYGAGIGPGGRLL
ncbi:MAG: DnaT-like ssDNA-binding domain-containing protein [Ramlibacter sp.]